MSNDTKKPLVLGVHGFGQKPQEDHLEANWEQALAEGLRRNCGYDEPIAEHFEMLYWYDNVGGRPVVQDYPPFVTVPGDDPFPRYRDHWIHNISPLLEKAGAGFEWILDKLMKRTGLHAQTRAFLDRVHRHCRDYHTWRDDRERSPRDELVDALGARADRRILLLGHSVGSVIAYEALRRLENEDGAPEIVLFTTGSPLGMPFVTADMQQRNRPNGVPQNVVRWVNFADRRDPITFDAHLRDDYPANEAGVEIEDRLVYNAYQLPGEPTREERWIQPHSIYGYLRTPELSERVRDFLVGETSRG